MKSQLKEAFEQLSAPVSQYLLPIFSDDTFDGTLSAEQYAELLTLSGQTDPELRVSLLPLAAAYSYAPISKFYVGAIARGLSGRLYIGANVEVTGSQLNQTIHAEQCAISHAWMKGEEGLIDITINFSPCGHCRQFMRELSTSKDLKIQLPNRAEKSLEDYLPDSFGPEDLGVEKGLMSALSHGKTLEESDPLMQSALDALNKSHAPYSENLSGIALQLTNGKGYKGAYAENAAFNPSLPPLQVALVQLLMDSESIDSIETCALVEMTENLVSHLPNTQATLEAINPDISVSYLSL